MNEYRMEKTLSENNSRNIDRHLIHLIEKLQDEYSKNKKRKFMILTVLILSVSIPAIAFSIYVIRLQMGDLFNGV